MTVVTSRKQLRSFGLILAAGFLVVAMWPMVMRGQPLRSWALTISLLFGLGGLVVPGALRWPYRIWMAIGYVLGWINSKIILGSLFYVMFTPVRLILLAVGHDPMNRGFDGASPTYRVTRVRRPPSHMKHQF
jgi:hypothetical protein